MDVKVLEKLSLVCTGIGSLPFKNENAPKDAVECVFECCPNFPYWPQLPHFKKEEDMALQFSQNLLGLKYDGDKYYLDDTDEAFFEGLESLFVDYETVVSSDNLLDCEEILDKYKISKPYSNSIDIFFEKLKNLDENNKPDFIKGSITGPFTFSTSFCDKDGKSAYYNETLREVAIKTLSLKALWQIKEFKKINKKSILASVPVIFMDEPSISQVGSCAFVSVKKEDVILMLKTISDDIKKFGAISGIHCCGKTDWDIAIESNVDIINFDAYFYAKSVGTYAEKLKKFMEKGGALSFGIIPTLDKDILKNLDKTKAYEKFTEALECFTSKNIDKNIILSHSFITPSCGCGSLDIEMAKHALNLTNELSKTLLNESKVKL